MPPIFQTSTYAQRAPGDHYGYEYARVSNPTRTALEGNLAALEGAEHGICFSSGVAATDAIVRSQAMKASTSESGKARHLHRNWKQANSTFPTELPKQWSSWKMPTQSWKDP